MGDEQKENLQGIVKMFEPCNKDLYIHMKHMIQQTCDIYKGL